MYFMKFTMAELFDEAVGGYCEPNRNGKIGMWNIKLLKTTEIGYDAYFGGLLFS